MDIMSDLYKKSRNGNILFVSIEAKTKKFSAFSNKKHNQVKCYSQESSLCLQD